MLHRCTQAQGFHPEHDHRPVAGRHGSHHGSSRFLTPETKDPIDKVVPKGATDQHGAPRGGARGRGA